MRGRIAAVLARLPVVRLSVPALVSALTVPTLASALPVCLPTALIAAQADPASLRNRAAALLDNGDEEKAIEIFRDVVKRLPSSAPDRINLGIALLGHNDLDGAEAELRKALESDPN